MRTEDVIIRPLITEKATELRDEVNIVAFEVAMQANKVEIERAVEEQFDVAVDEVRVARMRGKVRRQGRYVGRRPDWKKAYVRLKAGEKPPEFFEGV